MLRSGQTARLASSNRRSSLGFLGSSLLALALCIPGLARAEGYDLGNGGWATEQIGSDGVILRTDLAIPKTGEPGGTFLFICDRHQVKAVLSLQIGSSVRS